MSSRRPVRHRRLILLSAAAAAVPLRAARAQDTYPTRPITFIVGWPPGGPSDNVARLIAPAMGEALGQSLVIDNRAGAGGNIGSQLAARAKPDGYTIMLATVASHGLNSELYSKLNYDPIADFAPIGMISSSPSVMLVPSDSPYRSVKDVIDAAKASPGKLNYGSGGIGSSQHLAGARFKNLVSIDVVHVPFKGTAPAIVDLMAGRLDYILTTGAVTFVRSGKLRALAVAAKDRIPGLPEVPTFDEVGVPGFHTDNWYGLVAPAGTPKPVLDKLNEALTRTVQSPTVQQQFIDQGAAAVKPMDSDAFWAFAKKQMPEAAEMVRMAGAKVE